MNLTQEAFKEKSATMKLPTSLLVAILLTSGSASVLAQNTQSPPAHDSMDHGAMPGMAGAVSPQMPQDRTATQGGKMPGMTHGAAPTEDSAMPMAPMQGGDAPPDARDPHAYSDGYDFGSIPPPRMGDTHRFGSLLVDRLERSYSRNRNATVYDLQAWYGLDYDRAVLKAEGDVARGKLQEARTELLWGHAVATYWDTQLGVRYDSGVGPERGWLALGVQGLAPYWFDVEATAYIGSQGRSALRLAASYDLLLTQKLILQPRAEANFYAKSDPARELGSGMSDLSAGLRLRYEVTREFAPYVGIEWNKKYGDTANFARAAGAPTRESRIVAGVRFWF